MQALPHDVYALFALAFAFGIKHGLDPDHLATIDGLSRFNAATKPWLAKWAGVLFSIGHGVVVTVVAGAIALMPSRITLPDWLEGFGAAVSILTLLALGGLNLYAAFNRQDALARPIGLKSWMRIQSGHPAIVLGIGALFALSFDTMSNAAFFSLAATQVSGELYAFALGIVFTCGMIVSDGVNGILTARFIRQSNNRAVIASRVMSFAIGSVSLFVAFMGISRLFIPTLSEKIDHFGIWPGMAVFVWVAAGFAVSLYIARLAAAGKQGVKS
ncbi:HoxN/HupN/NixA family nickel/cobalt transporter [Sulfurirhabdus autotrophica]|uniref:Nickel/cobalt efflux system n=1 Tax=Sulfurirhabdus autotrophica TaxID=1706046 RepID=A0A4R3Y177_9PROT|nr:nickel transporter [Sulfurirhabdus autotrophica]TCV85410.1 high-affinity nickel-transport protein [Sulfurirhabdus autotrophica]